MIKHDPGGDRSWSGALKSGKRGELPGLTNSAGRLKGDCATKWVQQRSRQKRDSRRFSRAVGAFYKHQGGSKECEARKWLSPQTRSDSRPQLQDPKSCCSPCWRQELLLVDQRNIFPPNPFPGWTRQGHRAPNSLFSSALLPALLLQGSPAQVEGKVGVPGRSLIFS